MVRKCRPNFGTADLCQNFSLILRQHDLPCVIIHSGMIDSRKSKNTESSTPAVGAENVNSENTSNAEYQKGSNRLNV